MSASTWLLAGAFVLAAALPIIGFARLLWRAQRAVTAARREVSERGFAGTSWGDLRTSDHRRGPLDDRRAVIWDMALVGSGLIIGGLASILALPGVLMPM